LAFMNAPSGSLIAYSTAPGKTALDGTGMNSIYTTALLQHIDTPNITVLQMFQRVRSTVMDRSGNKQIPWESTSLRGNFYFNNKRRIAIKHHKEKQTKTSGRLFVNTEPEDARVRILNIKPRFYQGIGLEPGKYHVEVSKGGYEPKEIWTNLRAEEDKTLQIGLERSVLTEKNPFDSLVNGSAEETIGYIHERYKDMPPTEATKRLEAVALNSSTELLRLVGRDLKAIKMLNKAIELDPNYVEAYVNRGLSFHELQQYRRAIQDFGKAIVLDPNCAEAYRNRGMDYAFLQQKSEAIRDFDKAIALEPNYAQPYSDRGMAYMIFQQYTKAIQDFDKAIGLDPNHVRSYNDRGMAYAYLRQDAKAIRDFDRAIELNSELPGPYVDRGLVYCALKQYTKAIQNFDKAIELNPKEASVYYKRGASYSALNQYVKALQDFDKGIDLDPKKDASVYNARGILYMIFNKISQGCADFKKACDLGDCHKLDEYMKLCF